MANTVPTFTELSAPKLKLRKYGFAIVDRNGDPYWAEDCVCEDREPLEGLLVDLNYPDDPKSPYKVVRLYWRGLASPAEAKGLKK